MNWTTYDYSPAPCLPCCVVVTPCFLTMPTLLIDGTTSNYADSTTAAAAISAQAAPGCYFETQILIPSWSRTSFSSSFTGGTLSTSLAVFSPSGSVPGSSANATMVIRCFLTSADGLSIVYAMDGNCIGPFINSGSITLYLDDQMTVVDSVSGANPFSGTFNPTIPSDGYYWIAATSSNAGVPDEGDATASNDLTVTGGASFVPCPVRAAYDDGSGGTSYVICA